MNRLACLYRYGIVSLALLLSEQLVLPVHAEEFAKNKLVISEFLVIPQVGRYGRVPNHVDPLQAAIAKGSWKAPYVGDSVLGHGGRALTWNSAKSDSTGWLEHSSLRGGYAYAEVTTIERQVVLLEASGHAMVFINGEPRVGDPYLTGRTILPIVLREGRNELLFHCAAGKLRAELIRPQQEVFFDQRDMTLPSLVEGETSPLWLGVLLVNCREKSLVNCQATASFDSGSSLITKVDSIPPLGVRKVAIPLDPSTFKEPKLPAKVPVNLSLNELAKDNPTATTTIELSMVGKQKMQRRTFRSKLDQSVQAYDVLPAETNTDIPSLPVGMLVTLHSADESGGQQLAQYGPVPSISILAPSGRRTKGCDWEGWSATDALEALDDAAQHFAFDARRVWLRGTGTGGHGALRLGSTAPNRWAALAPTNAWLEYAVRESTPTDGQTPIQAMLARINAAGELAPLLVNTAHAAILLESIGQRSGRSADDSREIAQTLSLFHPDFIFRQRTDFTPASLASAREELLRFCRDHTAPLVSEVDLVDCVTFDPGKNSRVEWLTILQQIEQGSLSRAAVRYDPEQRLYLGMTSNVAALSIAVAHLEKDTTVDVVLDGEPIGQSAVDGGQLIFVHDEFGWHPAPELPKVLKQPQRYGGFRSVFANQPILVYGTHGSDEENAWALAKSRYDAETWLVRTNGSIDVVADTSFDPTSEPDRNIMLYGNADTNSAWPRLLSTSPVQVRNGNVIIDRRPEVGDDLACVFVRPRQRSSTAIVGVVSGTGITGMRATDRLPYFVNGVNFPDLLLLSAESLTQGDDDIRAAGYFGLGWTVEPGEIVWRDVAL
ncbi:alpha/beta hydrolase family protein [Bythopirellula polymerisocia]|uniref:Peptidase S9 prolyl oligopeptidase catalytic domain-containing protein n=1 Tax=Bythopirellula polymerisocia TaxID=2528003 RepID=A0A5C6D3I2_9BACT|nr:hypothetical protein [Bythopirellula polymerisocia]TWU29419.1 hypothetical protein Pla144_01970 [Bythopirellula polymerisocia]